MFRTIALKELQKEQFMRERKKTSAQNLDYYGNL